MATVGFGPLRIAYDRKVLEPRPWTLAQARWAVELSPVADDGAVLELCSGAGQIGLVVAVESGRGLVQVDDDEHACRWARHNAEAAGIAADVRCAPVDAALSAEERFPLALADPPYVPSGDARHLVDDPRHAIDGGADGLDVARRCLVVAGAHLVAGGRLLLQTRGAAQAARLAAHAAAAGLTLVEVRQHAADRAVALLRRG